MFLVEGINRGSEPLKIHHAEKKSERQCDNVLKMSLPLQWFFPSYTRCIIQIYYERQISVYQRLCAIIYQIICMTHHLTKLS